MALLQTPNILRRQSTELFLDLIRDPFQSQIQSDALLTSLGTSLGVTIGVALLFCFLRPYNTVVYAPRLKKNFGLGHGPPPVGKGIFAWVPPILSTKEQTFVSTVGQDAAVFIRFTKMCRNMFFVLSLVGCSIIIPVNVVGGQSLTEMWDISVLMKMTPSWLYNDYLWAFVVCAYVFDIVICYFLWINYRAVIRLQRQYFNSPEYQASLYARTLLVTDIPKSCRTDDGLLHIVETVKSSKEDPIPAISRNVHELPELISEYEDSVRALEKHLAKYLKRPDHLPSKRPMCSPSKKDKIHIGNEKVDAIDYLTVRIRLLESEIRVARESIDNRNSMPFGFVSYGSISEAHSVAYAGRRKHPKGVTIALASKPKDIIWENLKLSKKQKRWKSFSNNLWVALLTVIWIVPNALIAVFVTNLWNLGRVWPNFNTQLETNPKFWAAVQGIASPAILSLFYYLLPSIFRRLSIRAGDKTKTSRENHVTHKLYAFFVFNNFIVFSIFSAVWSFVATVIQVQRENSIDVTDFADLLDEVGFVTQIMTALCQVSPFWVTWLLQRNLGAAIDLSQVANLAWGSFRRKFMNLTPREHIEKSAPPAFDYASYHNYFLFYATIALSFATLQPIVLPVTALYFALDSYFKKYLLLYVFVTKNESGGKFWRVLFNRVLFAAFLGNFIIGLVVKSNGTGWGMTSWLLPLPFLLIAFKWYCKRTFDDQIKYFSKGDLEDVMISNDQPPPRDRVSVRFGHPALYKSLMTPMVHAKSQHLLSQVYRGRINSDSELIGYNEEKYGHKNPGNHPGRPPYEIVNESQLDFEHYKNRPDFCASADVSRSGTPTGIMDLEQRRGDLSERGVYNSENTMLKEDSPDTRSIASEATSKGQQVHGPYSDTFELELLRQAAPIGRSESVNTRRSPSPSSSGRHGFSYSPIHGSGEAQNK